MSEHVAKVIEVVGTSDESIEKAIETAVERTAESVRNLRWFQMTELRGHIADGKVERYQVMLKIGFALDEK
ncbi:dodecin [Sphingomonas solaris]|uniref:Dodecin domain-containing protein n=1 Tax=Alterirhizorhabdus solaris TaxID=2529389 RepID=A0A558RBS4_9SPHN|nr:dodecin [Sphingomonas solaris]TVV76824.1 dodecin domain-containing protein [Sphingomonas solaris]